MKRPQQQSSLFEHDNNQEQKGIVVDLENSVPPSTFKKTNTEISSSINPIKIKETSSINSSDRHKTPGQKRKALGDITNQEKTIQPNQPQQPPKKKKSELVDKKTKNSEQSIIKQTKKPQLELPEECEPIEFCPQASVTDFLEYPTPIFMEFNPETGKAEDVFVTLSDEKMKQLTKLQTKEESSLPFTVCVDSSVSGLPLPSPMPSAISPISFDDIFDVL